MNIILTLTTAQVASMSGSAVTILSPTGGRLLLEEQKIREIFCSPDTKDLPASIVSVAGAMRTGKSFILGKTKKCELSYNLLQQGRTYMYIPKYRVAPDIWPARYSDFFISGIRPDIRFHLPDIW